MRSNRRIHLYVDEHRSFRNAKWPTFWQSLGPQGLHLYQLRLLFDTVPMQWDWPVSVNLHEAQAFAAWRTANTIRNGSGTVLRVMTELEHHAIRDSVDHKTDPVQNYSPFISMAQAVSL